MYYCANHGKSCATRAQIVYPKDKEDVVYYYESADKHSETERCENGLSKRLKDIIEEILKDGHKQIFDTSHPSPCL